jgi:hypothetical protein
MLENKSIFIYDIGGFLIQNLWRIISTLNVRKERTVDRVLFLHRFSLELVGGLDMLTIVAGNAASGGLGSTKKGRSMRS